MLLYDRFLPDGARDGLPVLVLLHGRGSHRGDLQALRPSLPADWALVTPQAPHPGHPWGYGPGWAWYRYVAEDTVDEATLAVGMADLDAFLDGLPALLGVTPGRLVVGGFSQGGTMSLAWALRNPGRADVLNFSGFLIDSPTVPRTGAAVKQARVFWGHGFRDPAIPFALAQKGRAALVAGGATLDAKDYEIGHWIAPEEIADAVGFLGRA